MVNAVSKHGVFKDNTETAFSSKFSQTSTTIAGNIAKIKQYAQKVEGIQISEPLIITVVNSPRYSGTCYMFDDASISFVPVQGFDSMDFAGVIQHEAIGHGLGKLGDEYILYKGTINESSSNHFTKMQSK